MTLDCFVCGKTLSPAVTLTDEDAGDVVPPYGGVGFESHGNYGSAVFDPVGDREFMVINVCDQCLLDRAELGRVAHGRSHLEIKVEWETFNPPFHNS